ncbi:MAG TPA: thioredoxin-disulfide reductase [Chthonomonadales bacterium]|nr:thioredoxin-disulfide reductase [Chthonomonadales bacterium]
MTDPSGVRPLVILGSGPAGYTAALYAARANLEPVLVDGGVGQGQTLQGQGGQLTITGEVENYPGFEHGIPGPELMLRMRQQVARFGVEFVEDLATEVCLSERPLRVVAAGAEHRCRVLIVATGASARWLGIDAEKPVWEGGLGGAGISACATCDGALPAFRNREVAVVGGGDTAVEEALYLTHFASKVYVIHRRDALRASRIMQRRLFEHPKVEPVWNKVVVDVQDRDAKRVTAAVLRDTQTEEISSLPIAGLFIAIGHRPNSQIVAGQVDVDENGYIRTHDDVRTSVPGVFACGDVQDHRYRQAVTAAGSGCMAAIQAERFLAAVDAGEVPDW